MFYKANKLVLLCGFSLVEIIVGLIVISSVLAAIAPVITKKISKNTTTISASSSNTGASLPVGTIVVYLGQTAPDGWLMCDGNAFNVIKYPKLYQHLKSNHTPDMRGYTLKGATQAEINEANGVETDE